MKFKKYLCTMFLILVFPVTSEALVKEISFKYCEYTHPVEFFSPIRNDNTCEEQHVIQQQQGGLDWGNITVIPASSHITTDSWGGGGVWKQKTVWASDYSTDRPGGTGDAEDALEQAYRLGRYQLEYSFFLYDYRGDEATPTILTWDGVSHLVYTISWWANFPAKYLRKTAYIIEKDRPLLIIDHLIQFPILITEGVVGFFYSIFGVIAGTIAQPLDTFFAFFGGVALIISSVFGGILDIFLTLFAVCKSIFTVCVVGVIS